MNENKKVVVYGGSFNPPGLHHRQCVEELTRQFDLVLIVPCGHRKDKPSFQGIKKEDRRAMIEATFSDLEKTKILWFDFDEDKYTITFDLDKKIRAEYGENVWHAFGTDLIQGGAYGQSEIQRCWDYGQTLWENLNFAIINREEMPASPSDFPAKSIFIRYTPLPISSTKIRNCVKENKSISDMVMPEVENYILKNGLYKN